MLDCFHGSSNNYLEFSFENTTEWSQTYLCSVYYGKEDVCKTLESCFFPSGNMKFDMNGAIHFILDSYDEKFMMVEEIYQHICVFLSYSNTLCSFGTNVEIMPC
jgi:hypothetical protein